MKGWLRATALAWLAVVALTPSALAQTPINCPPEAPAAAQLPAADGKNRGLLWRLTRDGRTSYLFATMHLGQASWRELGPAVKEAMRDSDLVALELDLGDPDILRDLVKVLTELATRPPIELSDVLRQRVAALARVACLPEASIGTMHPLLQAMSLTMKVLQREGLHPVFGQEFALKQFAMTNNRHVLSLETPAQQFAAMLPEPGDSLERNLARAVTQLEQGRAGAMLRRMASAWERGDFDELAAYASWCECADDAQDRRALVRMNDERNAPMAKRIDELHRRDLKVFAAVGALHMTGEQALPRLFQQMGFQVERVVMSPMMPR